MGDYQVGDTVRIWDRTEPEYNIDPYYNTDMTEFAGMEATIKSINYLRRSTFVRLDVDNMAWWWAEPMISRVEDTTPDISIEDLYAILNLQ